MRRTLVGLLSLGVALGVRPASADPVAPTPPPPPAMPEPPESPPPAPPPPPLLVSPADPPLAGYKDGLFYLRTPHDLLRLYPHALLDLDARGFFGSEVDTVSSAIAGVNLAPRFYVRHARFDLAGEIVERIAFDGGIELVANPSIDGSRVDGQGMEVALADAWGLLDAGRGLGVVLGVFQAPFSLENRTATPDVPMMERNMAIRGFAASGGGKALGGAIVGSTRHQVLHWEGGVFGAETIAPTDYEQHFDGIGRLVLTPAGNEPTSPGHDIEVGLSARAGSRTRRDTNGDIAAITTGEGFALWRPTYLDGQGRLVHIIPDSLQYGAGLELRVPFCGFVFQSEGYWVSKGTREAPDGLAAAETLRAGTLQGVGWYAELSWWPFETMKLLPPGRLPRTDPQHDHLELAKTTPLPGRSGIEVAILGGGINATYDGASRSGTESTFGAQSVELYQLGAALSYWQSASLRLTVSWNTYLAPTSQTPGAPSTVVPGNLGSPADSSAHALHELAARVSFMF